MTTSKPSHLLALPAELRIEIYDTLFRQIHHSSIRGAIALGCLLQTNRQICSEATPRMKHYVELRIDELRESLRIIDEQRDANTLESETVGNAASFVVRNNPSFRGFEPFQGLEETFYRDQRGKFQVLRKRLRNIAALAERWG